MYRLYTTQMYENPASFHGIYVLFKDVKLTHVYHAISLTLWQKKIINLYSLNWYRSTMIIINKKWDKNTREYRTTYQFCRLSKSTRLIWETNNTHLWISNPKKCTAGKKSIQLAKVWPRSTEYHGSWYCSQGVVTRDRHLSVSL